MVRFAWFCLYSAVFNYMDYYRLTVSFRQQRATVFATIRTDVSVFSPSHRVCRCVIRDGVQGGN